VDTVDNSGPAGDADGPEPPAADRGPLNPRSQSEVVLRPGDGSEGPPVAQRDNDTPSPTGPNPGASGSDLARDALRAAQAAAAARGHRPGAATTGKWRRSSRGARRRGWSGSGADDRDPQPLGRLAAKMAKSQGWNEQLVSASVFGRWAELVGADVAEHATPISLKDGELTVAASSTAWATQLRTLQRQLLGKIAAGLGPNVVRRMKIQGPSAPTWRKGPRHAPGRGPRDTYG
jgi:predicted nucleic acid-binding Zn ribbon protein